MSKKYNPTTLGIIGFGRFGSVLHRMLSDYFDIVVYDPSYKPRKGIRHVSLKKLCESNVVVFAVPISKLESVVRKTKPYLRAGQTVLDVCSVKVYPKKVLSKHLKDTGTFQILTHPMFGPDSSKDGFTDLPIMMYGLDAPKGVFVFWKQLFNTIGLRVVEMTPEEHDRQAAFSQGVTHFMGRVFNDMKLTHTQIDSTGFIKLMEVVEQTCHDTWELFRDLQTYNPYTQTMRNRLERSFDRVNTKLLPARSRGTMLTIGIQGGKGSFNEEACHAKCKENGITNYHITYLYISERVLKAVHERKVDIGQCATQNSVGGVVRETIYALAKYESNLSEEFEFLVNHCLHVRPGTKLSDIKTIMSHPQVFKQCQSTLAKKYPHITLKSGTGNFIDSARAAKELGAGKLPTSVAVMAPKVCAQLYNLETVDEGLQDRKDNYTSFVWLTPR